MALHIKLGKFNYEQDRIDAVNKSFKKRYGHSGLRVIHSSLTLKGKLRKIFNLQYK